MTTFTMGVLEDAVREMDKVTAETEELWVKFFANNGADIKTHCVALPARFKDLLSVPHRLNEIVFFSTYVDGVYFFTPVLPNFRRNRFGDELPVLMPDPRGIINLNGDQV